MVQRPECLDASSLIRLAQLRLDEHLNRHQTQSKDGVEIGALCFDERRRTVGFAGCGIGLVTADRDRTMLLRGSRPLTMQARNWAIPPDRTIAVHPGTRLCVFSDGVVDQWPHPSGRRIGSEGFRRLVANAQHLSFTAFTDMLDRSLFRDRDAMAAVDDRMLFVVEPTGCWTERSSRSAAA
jgi:hypothetical protein